MKRTTFPMVVFSAGWMAATAGTGIDYGWGQALIGWGFAAIVLSFFLWVWNS